MIKKRQDKNYFMFSAFLFFFSLTKKAEFLRVSKDQCFWLLPKCIPAAAPLRIKNSLVIMQGDSEQSVVITMLTSVWFFVHNNLVKIKAINKGS